MYSKLQLEDMLRRAESAFGLVICFQCESHLLVPIEKRKSGVLCSICEQVQDLVEEIRRITG